MNFDAMTDEQIQLGQQVAASALEHGIDPNFAVAIALSESSLHKKTKDAGKGAIGTMQVLPENAASFGYTPEELDDPASNIDTGVRMLRQSLDRYGGDPVPAAIEYFAGPSAVKKYFDHNEDPSVLGPKTQNYLNTLDSYHPLRDEKGGIPEYSQSVEPTTQAEQPTEVAPSTQEDQNASDRAALIGGTTGAGIGAVAKMALPPSVLPTAEQTARAQEALSVARDRLTQLMRVPNAPMPDIAMAQQAVQAAEQELLAARDAATQFRGRPPVAPASAAPTLAEEVLRASGPRVEGASGASNWMRAMAGEGHQLPESLLSQATDMTKANPTGGQALINKDLARLQKINALGASDYSLAGEGKGQLMLPPSESARLNQELAAKQAAQSAAAQQAAQAAEAQRLAAEQAHAQARSAAGQRVSQAKLAQDQARAALHQTQSQATGATRQAAAIQAAQDRVEVARRAAQRMNPSTMARLGLKLAKSPMLTGTIGGAGIGLSLQDAIERFQAGDTSEGVLSALEAAFGAMAMLPARSPGTLAAKGIGAVGGLGLAGGRAAYHNWPAVKQEAQKPASEIWSDVKSQLPDVKQHFKSAPATP